MKKVFLHILFLLIALNNFAQNDSALQLFKTYKTIATDFNVDQMGNLYIVTATGQLKKMNSNGDSIAVYNLNKKYGKLSQIDVTNPLKVLLYFRDYSTIITVDRLLNITNTIDLRKQNIYQVKALATSYDGQFWFYDEQEAKIKKINEKGKVTLESVDLRQVLKPLPSPIKIIDNDNLLYLYDPFNGVYVFDYYGALKTSVPLIGWNNFYAFNKTVYGFKNDTLQKYTIGIPITKTKPLNKENIPLKLIVAANKIYFLDKNEIRAYYNK